MKCRALLTAVAFVVLAVGSVYANEKWSVDEKVQKMKSELNLTDEQVNQVRPIIQDYKNKMDKLGEDKKNKLNKVLSPEQMDQLKEMKDKKKDKMNMKDKDRSRSY